jgi:hypothetical protein
VTGPDDQATPGPATEASGPIALDGLAYGIDLLDAVLVFHLGDAHLHALWVRPEGGVRPDDVVTTLRDVYRVAQFAGKRLAAAPERRGEAPAPLITIELPQRTAVLRRIRAHVVACLFDADMPLGMARLVAGRLGAALEPELPLGDATDAPAVPKPRPVVVPVPPGAAVVPQLRPPEDHGDRPPHTLNFASPRRSRPPRPPADLDRASRLLAYLEEHAPEPHVVRHRLALRAGLTLAALEHPEGLGPEAMVLLETAVQDILGIDRAELRRIA